MSQSGHQNSMFQVLLERLEGLPVQYHPWDQRVHDLPVLLSRLPVRAVPKARAAQKLLRLVPSGRLMA